MTYQQRQLLPNLSSTEYETLKADIEANGIRVPVEVDESGRILDGHHRLRIADELGIEAPTVTVTAGDERESDAYSLRVNLNRRQLSVEQRKQAAKAQRLVARALNTDHT